MSAPTADPAAWLRRFGPPGPAPARLVCLPHAGGSASWYLPMQRALAAELDVVAVQYPGRQDRRTERPLESIAELADNLAVVLSALDPCPLALFGHSMGATLAFEVTRRLEASGQPAPARLFVSGRRAPSRHRPSAVHRYDDAGILTELRRLGGTDSRLLQDPDLVRAALPAIRADYRAIETYVCPPEATVASPISALVGDRDPQTSLADAQAWALHTTGGFDLRTFPGDHFFLTGNQAEVTNTVRNALFAVTP